MIEVIQKCMTSDFANFSGRLRRRDYWMFVLPVAIVFAVLWVLFHYAMSCGRSTSSDVIVLLGHIILIVILIPLMSSTVRRLHDTGKSGLFALIAVVPFVGLPAVLVLGALPGVVGANKYGADPKAAEAEVKTAEG